MLVVEGDQPELPFTARHPDGSPVDLTDVAAVQWVSKASPEAPDAGGVTIPATVVNAPAGEVTVQLTAPVTATPGTFFCKLVVLRPGQTGVRPFTCQFGPLLVVDA